MLWYLGAAPIPYVQDVNLNLPNSYLKITTVLLDKSLTLNRHSAQFHWACTVERGCSVGTSLLINCHMKAVFSHLKLMLKIAYSIVPRVTNTHKKQAN